MRAFRPHTEHPALEGVSAERIAEWCGCHLTTARRWRRGEEPPHAALVLIELLNTGDLGVINPAWSGWRLRDDRIYGPSDDIGFTGGDIMSITWLRTIIASYQTDMRLPMQGDWIQERLVPAKEIVTG